MNISRPAAVYIIVLAAFAAMNSIVAEVPAGLGHWSAGIDYQRHSLVTDGSIEPRWADERQAALFQQASADPVYSLVYAAYTSIAGSVSTDESYKVLYLLPIPFILQAVAAYLPAQLVFRISPTLRESSAGAIIPLVFLIPVGRFHTYFYGHSGTPLAAAILMVIFYLYMRLLLDRVDWRFVGLAIILSLTLVNTYHTWATYFAVGTSGMMLYGLALGKGLYRSPSARLFMFAPLFWIVTSIYLGNGALFDRMRQFALLVAQGSPLYSGAFGHYRIGTNPLADFTLSPPIFAIENLVDLGVVGLLTLITFGAALTLWRSRAGASVNVFSEFGLALLVSVGLVCAVLAAFGGVNLAVARGFEYAGVVLPFIWLAALFVWATNPKPLNVGHARNRSPPQVLLSGFVLSLFIGLVIISSVQDAIEGPREFVLTEAESTATASLAARLPGAATVFSDHRLGPHFLFHGPTAFVTVDTAVRGEGQPDLIRAIYYNEQCVAFDDAMHRMTPTVVVSTRYMRENMILLREGQLIPSDAFENCLDRHYARIYDSGDVAAYDIPRT